MAKEKVSELELDLVKEDEYYLFYEMMMQTLRTDNVKKGMNKSLSLLRLYLQSNDVVLYKKNKEGIYVYRASDSHINDSIKKMNGIVNKTADLIESKEMLNIDLNLSEDQKNIMLIGINMSDNNYIISISNYNRELEPHFWEKLRDTMKIIIKRSDSYEKNVRAINTDLLTGLNNRNAYEMRLQRMDESTDDLVLGIFDLFRLKYINDNYSHAMGDTYIQEVAKILNKYWPKFNVEVMDIGIEKINSTGHCIYRVGGDEFVLLTDKEDIEVTKIKAQLAAEEVSRIVLDTNEDIPLGLNYGIVEHLPGDKIKNTYINADMIMSEDKKQMYLHYGLERRK